MGRSRRERAAELWRAARQMGFVTFLFWRVGVGHVIMYAAIIAAIAVEAVVLADDGVTIAKVNVQNDRASCRRSNDVRREVNHAEAAAQEDARSLVRLTLALTHTRRVEQATFRAIGVRFGIAAEVAPLVGAYELAVQRDLAIARREARLSFRPLVVVNCRAAVRPTR